MKLERALIPAAGRGVRVGPRMEHLPKVMLEVGGRPLVERNIELLRDDLDIRDFTLIVGYMAERIRERLGDGSSLDVRIRYVHCEDVEAGLARGILLARPLFDEPFVVLLGDELYLDSNHGELRELSDRVFTAACGVMRTSRPELIRCNYSVKLRNGRVAGLVEKPERVENELLGCGTYVFTPAVFDAIERTAPSPRTGRVELTDALDLLSSEEPGVVPFFLRGTYRNINTIADYHVAQHAVRSTGFTERRTSVVIPAFQEAASIAAVVRDFVERVDEVLVVDNGSTDGTAEAAADAGARVERVELEGYGDTIRWGLDHARGEVLIVTEADGSFRARDLGKLLEYLKDADMVVGTRTTRSMADRGTNMQGMVRLGNLAVAKLLEVLWWDRKARFTDVGCTYRALWRDAWRRIAPRCRGTGPELSPEMMVAALQARLRIVEVPVSYHPRVGGESKHSADILHLSRTAGRMLRTIARKRLERA